MRKYLKRNRAAFCGALICIFISNALAVVLQFFKGDVLDHAIAGEIETTIKYAVLLISFILGEVLFFFIYKRFNARFVVGCTRLLRHDIFESITHRDFVAYKQNHQGEYISKLTTDADAIKDGRFRMLPMFFDILFKIVFVSVALFRSIA